MAGSEDIVFEISGKAYMSCYQDLRHAVEITHEHLPAQISMGELTGAVVPRLQSKKTADSVARALARAAEDAWDNGGRYILENKYGFRCKPTPKELILKLARTMKPSVEYRLWKEDHSGTYGIIASTTDENHWMAVAPFLRDENKALAVTRVLNQSEVSFEQFRELMVSGAILTLIEGKADA